MITKSSAIICICVFIVSLIVVTPAHAYLDAGTGSMILQLILGGFAGLAVIVKLYWGNLKAFFRGKSADKKGQ